MSRSHFILVVCSLAILCSPSPAHPDTPELLPGWPPDIGDRVFLSSICLADVDGNGVQDVVIGTYGEEPDVYGDGLICVWDGSGNPLSGWPRITSGPVFATPSVADLDGDGDNEIIVASWGNFYVFEHDGTNHQGWPQLYTGGGTPTIENMDGDAELEIVIVTSGMVRIADHDGTIIATRSISGNLSNPAVGDADADGAMEVVVESSEQLVYLLEPDLTDASGWPQNVTGESWMINRPPALGDLDGDGTLEVVSDVGGLLHVFQHDGSEMSGWPQNVAAYGNNMPICCDMDGDGTLEVVSAKSDTGNFIYIFEHDGSPFGSWPFSPAEQVQSSAAVGDVDGDGDMELVFKQSDLLTVFHHDTSVVTGWPVNLSDNFHSGTYSPTPAIGDVNGDGFVDIVAAANFRDVVAYTVNESYLGTAMEWPMFAHDARHTARYQQGAALSSFLVAGPGPAYENPPVARIFPPIAESEFVYEFSAYGALQYGVNVTCGDVTGDHLDDILTGAGPGAIYGPHVRGFLVQGIPLPGLNFLAYGTNKYGVNVAAGDLDADGFDEVITGAGPGAVFGPHVRGWNYDGASGVTPVPGVSYFAYGTPKWGVNVSAGDIDSDGYDEIVTGAGPGAIYGPHVRGWNVDGGAASAMPGVSFLAYGTNRMGVNVTCGDVDGDGIDEIITGPGPSSFFGAHVRGWNCDGSVVTSMAGISFFAWPPSEVRYGAKVFAGADLDDDGWNEIVVGCADPSADTVVKVFQYDGSQVAEWFWLEAFPGLSGGTNVAAGRL